MRLLQIEDEPWDSGMAHYALTLAQELKRRGHDVYFWGKTGSPLMGQAQAAGLPVESWRQPWARLPRLRRLRRELGIELINAHTGSSHSLAAALAAFTDVAVVRTRGDVRPASKHALAQTLAERTRAFIAANSCIREDLAAAFPLARVVTIFQGLAPLRELPLPDAPVFGILGRLDPVKGHESLMAAAALLRRKHASARVLAVGGDPSSCRPRLDARVRELGLVDGWDFTGFVDDVSPALARCRVGVVASIGSEAVSRAALEWMSAGRPVIATGVGGLPDLVAHEQTGLLVPPNDPEALAEAMARFLEEPGLAADMGAAGLRRFRERFGLARFGDETEKLYAEILGHIPSRR